MLFQMVAVAGGRWGRGWGSCVSVGSCWGLTVGWGVSNVRSRQGL